MKNKRYSEFHRFLIVVIKPILTILKTSFIFWGLSILVCLNWWKTLCKPIWLEYWTHAHPYKHTHTHEPIQAHTHTHIHPHTPTHTHTPTHPHTHMLALTHTCNRNCGSHLLIVKCDLWTISKLISMRQLNVIFKACNGV